MLNKFYQIALIGLYLSNTTLAQTGLHDVDTKVQKVYFSEDGAKFLTAGYVVKGGKVAAQEIVLWDRKAALPIWRKTLTDFGLPEGNPNYYDYLIANRTLTLLTVEHSTSKVKYLLELGSVKSKIADRDFIDFTYDGQLLITQKDVDENGKKRKSTKLILKEYESGNEKPIDEYTFGASLSKKGDRITYFKKDFYKKAIVNFYDLKTNGYGTWPLTKNYGLPSQLKEEEEIVNIETYYIKEGTGEYYEHIGGGIYRQGKVRKAGKYFYTYSANTSVCNVSMGDLTLDKPVYTFTIIPLNETSSIDREIIFIGGDSYLNQTLFTVESGLFLKDNTRVRFSFLREYNRETGKLISEIPLTRLTDQAIADAKVRYEEYRKREEAEQRYINSPEGQTRKRMFQLWGLYLYSPTTKLIYQVVPDMPLYVGDLVKLIALDDDKKESMEVYEKIENVENRNMYTVISGHERCTTCNGKGYFSNSYKSTVADYEYTTGKKLVQTTTHSGSCGNCGGCGLVPKK